MKRKQRVDKCETRGHCQICGKGLKVDSDFLVSAHSDPLTGGRCLGSLCQPIQISNDRVGDGLLANTLKLGELHALARECYRTDKAFVFWAPALDDPRPFAPYWQQEDAIIDDDSRVIVKRGDQPHFLADIVRLARHAPAHVVIKKANTNYLTEVIKRQLLLHTKRRNALMYNENQWIERPLIKL